MTIGEKIRRQRNALGLSQEELAHAVGYKSRSSINKIELGINCIPTGKIKEFATALSLTPADLLYETNDEAERMKAVILSNFKGLFMERIGLRIRGDSDGNDWIENRYFETMDYDSDIEMKLFSLLTLSAQLFVKYKGDLEEGMQILQLFQLCDEKSKRMVHILLDAIK